MTDKAVLMIGVLMGFILIPPMARAWPVFVNGFLFLILLSSLLYNRERWLPYLSQLSSAASRTQGVGKNADRGAAPIPGKTTTVI